MSTRRQFMTSAAFTGMAVGVAATASGQPLTGFRKFLEPMIQAANLQSYHVIVRNTSSFKFSGNDAEDVRKFLENGGMYRTEKRPASKQEFASALYFEKETQFMVNTQNVVGSTITGGGSGQSTKANYVKIKPGMYMFQYNTESGITIRMLGSDKEVVQVALKPQDQLAVLTEPSTEINVTSHPANLAAIKSAIESTISIYSDAKNSEMAVLMEMSVDGLYRDGNLGRSEKFLQAYQSDRAKLAAKETVRSLMSFMEESAIRDISKDIAEMRVSGFGVPSDTTVGMARREFLALNNTVDNELVSFEVEKGEKDKSGALVMVVHNGIEFEPGCASYNPILQYRISGENKKGRVEFPNNYEHQFSGMVDGPDFDNSGGKRSVAGRSEDERESGMTDLYQIGSQFPVSLRSNEVKLFVVNISANVQDVLIAYSDAYRRHEGK